MITAPKENTPVEPKEVMRFADQRTVDLHKGVSDQLNKIGGHPTTPQSINPDPSEILSNVARVAGGITEESFGGATNMTHSGATKSKVLMVIAAAREGLKRRFQRK